MAVKARNVTPEIAYNLLKRAAVATADSLNSASIDMAANGADYDKLKGVYMTVKRWLDDFDAKKTTPGLQAWAKTAEDDPAYDAVSEFIELRTRAVAIMSWMTANVPTNVTAKPPSEWTQNGTQVDASFTAQQTAGLRTVIQGFVDWVV